MICKLNVDRAVIKEGRFLKRLIVVDLTPNLELLKKSKHQTKKTATTPTMQESRFATHVIQLQLPTTLTIRDF